jgi:hypothetical protein
MGRLIASRPLFWIVAVLILIVLGGVVVSHSEAIYVPLTMAQAKAYIDMAGPDEIAKEIIAFDWIQHVTPDVQVPASVVAVHGRDVSVAWQAPLIVDVPLLAGSTIVMPKYKITLQDTTWKEVVPAASSGGYIEAALLGAAAGAIAVLLLRH